MDKRQDSMYDLHGLSEEQAKACVVSAIRQASADHVKKLRFITGRGKHVNSRGERGTLFKKLPEWIKEFDYAELAIIDADIGLYDVSIKTSKLIISPEEKQFKQKLSDADKVIGQTIEFTKILADSGMPHAQYIYANCLENGNSDSKVEKNPKLAAEYMKKAADAKFPTAMHEYARFCLHGIGAQQSDEQAVVWLWKAHEAGVIEATESLARAYANAFYGLKYDFQKAFDLHTIAAKAGRTESMRFFGAIYLAGVKVERDEKLGFEWYERAAKLGDAKAQYNMGVFYTKGIYVKPDEEKANYYFKLSADNGDPDAQFIHGQNLLSKGPEFKPEGFKYIIDAAENGSETANDFLGAQSKGEGGKVWLQRSAQAGNLQSQLKLDKLNGINRKLEDIPLREILEKFRVLGINEIGLMRSYPRYQLLDIILLQAKGKDRRKAFNFISDLAEKDDADAIRRLIFFYERGEALFKLKKDPAKVTELLQKAVSLEDPVSMVKLACLIESDNRNDDRYTQAFALYEKARKLRYPAAFYYSGVYFEKGLCGKQDNKLALICYQKAIELEKEEGYLEKFIFGPLDQYESIIDKASAGIERLKPPVKSVSKIQHKTYSGLRGGFFKADTSKLGDDEKNSTKLSSAGPQTPSIAKPIPQVLPEAVPVTVTENPVPTPQAPAHESEPFYDVGTYITQTVSNIFSRFF